MTDDGRMVDEQGIYPTGLRSFTQRRGLTFHLLNEARELCSDGSSIPDAFARAIGAPPGVWIVSRVVMSDRHDDEEITLEAVDQSPFKW